MFTATATTFEGATDPRDPLVQVDEGAQRGDRERALREVVEVVSGQAERWTRIIAWGVAPWIRPSVTAL